ESGAEFVHGNPEILVAALREAGLRLTEVAPRRRIAVGGGELRDGRRDFAEVQRALDEPAEAEEAVDDLLRRRLRGKGRIVLELGRSFIRGFQGADPRRASAQSMAGEGSTAQARQIPAGYDQLVEHLAQPLEGRLRTSATVTAIRWRRGSVSVEA